MLKGDIADAGRLVGIRLTDYYTEEFPLIFALETLRIVPDSAWTFTMAKEAAINMLVVDATLRHYGYGLLDGHFGNITFKHNRPVFLDVGSLVKGQSGFISELLNYALMPWLSRKIKPRNWRERLAFLKQKLLKKLLKIIMRQKTVKIEYVDYLLQKCPQPKTAWQDYHRGCTAETAPTGRHARIVDLVKQFSPEARTCVDLAGNAGYIAHLLAQTGQFTAIINLDYDENAIESGREKFRDERIEFYCADTMLGAGIADAVKSDIVLGLALTHHLLLTQNYNIHAVLSIIARYTNRYAYLEFCPLGMYSGDYPDRLPPLPAWYNDDWFAQNFRKTFKILHREVVGRATVAGQERDHRILYIGQKLGDEQ
ncbi:hypothetical protein AGMMS49959_18620 [Planctomycetales bacterium]|nr:hypothetical protein AGMMS49959_18620 [Planctomycetales bacterium]